MYPSSKTVPANLLKFYIEFTQPVSRGMGYDYIRLDRSDGSIVADTFPEIGVALWDTQQQRFTVLLDPGHIKRGLKINEEMGLPLVPGGRTSWSWIVIGRTRRAIRWQRALRKRLR